LWVLLCLLDRRSWPGWLPLALPFAVFTAVSAVSALLSGDPGDAFGNMKNYLLFVVVWLTASLAADSRVRENVYGVLLVSGSGSALYGIALFILGKGRGGLHRTPGTFSNEMTFGGIMMLLLTLFAAMSVAPGIRRRLRIFSVAASLFAFTALLLTQTRSSWLAMAVSGLVIAAVFRKRLVPAYILALVAMALLAPQPYRDRISSIWDPDFRTNVQRIEMIKGGLSIFREHPVIGTGPVDLGEIYRRHMPPGAVYVHGHMHNIFLHVAVTLGAVGLAAFIWLLSAMSWMMIRTLRLDLPPPAKGLVSGAVAAMAGFIVNGLFEWNFGDAEVLTMMLIIVGLSAAAFREAGRTEHGAT